MAKSEKPAKSNSTGIKAGDKVSLDYEGKLESGEVFDSSKHGDHSHPLEFEVGANMVIPGFEKGVMGLKEGDEKEIVINPEDAYGSHNPEMIQKVPKSAFQTGQEPKVGMVLVLTAPDGRQFPVRITGVEKDTISLDMNHPLAGKKLFFKIKILKVN